MSAIQHTKNIKIKGSAGKTILLDISYSRNIEQLPVVLYLHGFCGFKDWGNGDVMAEQFVNKGFAFIKFNFSHNGTTPDYPDEFMDLKAFGNNNYSKELYDTIKVLDWISDKQNAHKTFIDATNISIIGHSRGGAIAILAAYMDPRIQRLATWASVATCNTPWRTWSTDKLLEWKEKKILFYENKRTNQMLPLHYQLYEDAQTNKDIFDLEKAIADVDIPVLICHGHEDSSVPIEDAYVLSKACPNAKTFFLHSDHTFGRKHPNTKSLVPEDFSKVLDTTIDFFKTQH